MHPLHHWLHTQKQTCQERIAALFDGTWPPESDFIEIVQVPAHWGVFASTGQRFQYAIFGRDSIETAEDLLATHPQLVHDIIIALCKLQGVKHNHLSEEEPGKIHHEHRTLQFNDFTIPEQSQHILRELQHRWGGEGTDEMTYYGTHDATPLFIRLVGSYVARYNTDILHETLVDKSGRTVSVRHRVLEALQWLSDKIAAHPLELFAYKRLNPSGLINQTWKDSETSYLHLDGSLPNLKTGVASIELQGYAYDALRTGLRLQLGTDKDRHIWTHQAEHLREQTVNLFWLENEHYFAQGIDLDAEHRPRPIATITSNPAALLDTQLLHDLPPNQATTYIQNIAKMIFSPELLTPVGVRCRAERHWELLDFIDYHGVNTIWPKETYDIAKGLRRAHMHHLAADLERRLIHSLKHAGEFYEFFYVSRNGKVWYDRDEALSHFEAESGGRELPKPERGQAWTIAAAIRIAYERPQREKAGNLPPPSDFEQSLLKPR